MKNLILQLAILLTSTSAFAASNLKLDCVARVKCPAMANCADRSLKIEIENGNATAVKSYSRYFGEVAVEHYSTSDQMISISGRDALGETFSARIDLNKLDGINSSEYITVGKYKLFRLIPKNLNCIER